MPFAIDTTCVISALCSWHPRQAAVSEAIEALLQNAGPLIIPAPVLVEAYSVLTRLPSPHRISPRVALKALQDSFQSLATIVSLEAEAYWRELERAGKGDIGGGAIYDAVIALAARRGGAKQLLTLNPDHFLRFAGADFAIVMPG
jgi:predicted nucleic acid-binding protein